MKIISIPIVGWCNGIQQIFIRLKKIIKENPNTNFYCFKELVHNKSSNDLLKKYNIKIIKNLNEIKDKNNSLLLLQAHGSTKELINELIKKHIKYIDFTCKFIKANESKINSKLIQGYKTYFIGSDNHQETKAFLSNNKKTKLIELNSKQKIKLTGNKNFITNQTTLTQEEVNKTLKKLPKDSYQFISGCCPEIAKRQCNVIKSLNKIDMLIVVGDKNSNNSNELVNIAKKNNKKSYLIQSARQLEKINFRNLKTIGICTGASTPKFLYEEIYNKLICIA